LLEADWPKDLLTHPGAAPEWGDVDDRVLYKGLRVRMGIHVGAPKLIRDPMSRRYEYVGVPVNLTARITALAHGGQILLSGAAFNKVKSTELAKEDKRLQRLGTFDIPEQPQGTRLYELKARGLEGRFFGGISNEAMRYVFRCGAPPTPPASAEC
jgi:class 3 adenylate cyclase